jgi:hypothetical protein
MPHHDGRNPTTSAAVVSMNVASADAASVNTDQQFVIPRLRLSNVDNVNLVVIGKHERLHSISLSSSFIDCLS